MDYEKKYKKALEIARKINSGEGVAAPPDWTSYEVIFPELKESEDEIIKKMCIEYLDRGYQHCSFADDRKNIEKCIAWLEKQKAADEEIIFRPIVGTDIRIAAKQALEKIDIGKKVVLAFNGAYIPVNGKTVGEIDSEYDAWLEKQGEKVTNINGEDYGIDGLYHAIRILEKTIGRVTGYQSDDGILEHKAAINAVKELYEKQGEKNINHIDIKEKAHQIAWETSKDYDPSLSKESWCEMAALDMASWLEKQDEKSINIDIESMVSSYEQRLKSQGSIKNSPLVNMCLTAFRHGIENTLEELNFKHLEKQGENKPTDKVEPKFKVGDFITNDYCLGKVIEITNDAYLLDTGQGIPFSCEHNAHLWTIEDAKDGDVLVTTAIRNCPFIYRKTGYNNNLAYYYAGIDGSGDFCEGCIKRTSYHFGPLSNVVPATKEQRDQLFQKMVEAGYEWDSEKKELKKVESKTLNANKVIEWLNENVADFWANPCSPKNVINQFKKDFGL